MSDFKFGLLIISLIYGTLLAIGVFATYATMPNYKCKEPVTRLDVFFPIIPLTCWLEQPLHKADREKNGE